MGRSGKNVALAISGGGYRSTLFALGSLWRLNEFGLLPQIDRITSVSGGSILSAYVAMRWNNLLFNPGTEVADNFKEIIADPIRRFCSQSLDIPAFLAGALSLRKTAGDKIAEFYSKRLFGEKTLQDIPTPGEGPEFVIYAASLQTGDGVRICKKYIADYKVGILRNPRLSLAQAVGASSALPPFFSPAVITCNPADWEETEGAFLYKDAEYRKKLVLTDGGAYDNMGLEAVWNDGFRTVFVCDAGAPWKDNASPRRNLFSLLLRNSDVIGSQTRRLRKRALIENYQELDPTGKPIKYGGTYWGINNEIGHYGLQDAMVRDNQATRSLQNIRTRLNKFSEDEQGKLTNWGYALTDAALRRWYFKDKRAVGKWPVPQFALDKYS